LDGRWSGSHGPVDAGPHDSVTLPGHHFDCYRYIHISRRQSPNSGADDDDIGARLAANRGGDACTIRPGAGCESVPDEESEESNETAVPDYLELPRGPRGEPG